MKLRPLQDRILVQRVEEETTTKGGIIIPDTAKEKPAEGKVVAVGNGKVGEDGKRVPLEVKKRTKTFIDVVVDSVATGIGGLILIFLVRGLAYKKSRDL